MADAERLGEQMARSAEAFNLCKIQGKTLRDAAKVMGCSYETVRQLVKAHQKYLRDDRTIDKEERRASFEAFAMEVQRRAFETYNAANPERTLSRVAALNTLVALMPHLRAVQGLDEPKESKADVEQRVIVTWGE